MTSDLINNSSDFASKTFLVTGGAGFIGFHWCKQLLMLGAKKVVVIDNFNDFYTPSIKFKNRDDLIKAFGNRITFLELDICNRQLLFDTLKPYRRKMECVIHLAAMAGVRPSLANPKLYLETNVNGTLNLLDWMHQSDNRYLLFASSSSVYGQRENAPFKETDDVSRPISPYAATKVMAENLLHTYAHLYGFKICALRYFTVYGPRQRPDLAIHKFSQLIWQNQPIPIYGDGEYRRDFTEIEDILAGMLGALHFNATKNTTGFEVFNLGESETTSVKELIALLETTLGKKAIWDYQPIQPGDVPLTCADITKAKALLGYAPQTPIAKGLEKFSDWFLENQAVCV